MTKLAGLALIMLTASGAIGGCAGLSKSGGNAHPHDFGQQGMEVLRAGVRYSFNPVVRVEAVEALESSRQEQALPWIRSALLDEHPAVRFAACVAVGNLRDHVSLASVSALCADEDPSVQVAALFACHRFGQTARSGRLISFLLEHDDPTVRRNAALVLGMLGEKGAVRLLARAMKDADAGVRQHALEAMARLDNKEARQELVFMTNSGVGSEEVFAINALASTGDATYVETFRYKLATALHLETRLAAGAALGRFGFDDGWDAALAALDTHRPGVADVEDPPAGHILRARQLSAAALGAMGRVEALEPLGHQMRENRDPRIQISAARAILEILAANSQNGWPLAKAANN